MRLSINKIIAATFLLASISFGCKKYLEKKPDQSLVVPSTFSDLQALLDNNTVMNVAISNGIGEASADNYYLPYTTYLALTTNWQRNIYIWESEIFFTDYPNDWSRIYRIINIANTVLEFVDKFEKTIQNQSQWANIKGSALFYRAEAFHRLAINFGKAYDASSASGDLGIPLRLTSDFNEATTRSNLQQTYERITEDLLRAISLLPVTAQHVMRPSRAAAHALLSRVYLSMRDYPKAGQFADSCIRITTNSLVDYSTYSASAPAPIAQFNSEVMFYSIGSIRNLGSSRAKIDSTLYTSYASDDLRKGIFFNSNGDGTFGFKGSYDGNTLNHFFGIALDEVYLNRAECYARTGNKDAAIADLNALMIKRWKSSTWVPFSAANANEALAKILVERRKELLMRDLRWMDIKRLNKEGANIILKRILNGQTFELSPNDNRYALPLPTFVIQSTGMAQNSR